MQISAGVAHRPNLARKGLARQALATIVVRGILKLTRVDSLTDVIATACVKSETGGDRATMGGDSRALNGHEEASIWPDRAAYEACMWLLGGDSRAGTHPKQLIGEHDREHVALAGPVGMLAAAVSALWWFVAMCWWVTDVKITRLIWNCCIRRLTCRQDRSGEVEVVVDGWPKDDGNRNGAATIAVMLATTRTSTLDARATEVIDMPIGVLSQASGEVYRRSRICADIVVAKTLLFLIASL
jgi:hypothetical protein